MLFALAIALFAFYDVVESISCGKYTPPVNGTVLPISAVSYPDSVTIYCAVGYKLTGSGAKQPQCQLDGTFQPGQVCTLVNCGKYPDVPNASIFPTGEITYPNAVKITCNYGFEYDGEYLPNYGVPNPVCTESGAFSLAFSCTPITCGVFTSPRTTVTPDASLHYLESAQLSCFPGSSFTGTGSTIVTCQGDKTFSQVKGCTRTAPQPTITPTNGSFPRSISVTITPPSTRDKSDIRYTLDGTVPTLTSLSYSSPFPLLAPSSSSIAVPVRAIMVGRTGEGEIDSVPTDAVFVLYGSVVCGDGVRVEGVEACDDGNLIDGDGCSRSCQVEANFQCVRRTLSATDYCSCVLGRYGPTCSIECFSGTTCRGNGECSSVTGGCMCRQGFFGSDCTSVPAAVASGAQSFNSNGGSLFISSKFRLIVPAGAITNPAGVNISAKIYDVGWSDPALTAQFSTYAAVSAPLVELAPSGQTFFKSLTLMIYFDKNFVGNAATFLEVVTLNQTSGKWASVEVQSGIDSSSSMAISSISHFSRYTVLLRQNLAPISTPSASESSTGNSSSSGSIIGLDKWVFIAIFVGIVVLITVAGVTACIFITKRKLSKLDPSVSAGKTRTFAPTKNIFFSAGKRKSPSTEMVTPAPHPILDTFYNEKYHQELRRKYGSPISPISPPILTSRLEPTYSYESPRSPTHVKYITALPATARLPISSPYHPSPLTGRVLYSVTPPPPPPQWIEINPAPKATPSSAVDPFRHLSAIERRQVMADLAPVISVRPPAVFKHDLR